VPELCVAPTVHAPLSSKHRRRGGAFSSGAHQSEPIAPEQADPAFGVHLEEDRPATVDEQVRVLGQDAVDEALAFEISELGIGLVGRDDVGDRLGSKRLRSRVVHERQ
jgi:hypothetical protein